MMILIHFQSMAYTFEADCGKIFLCHAYLQIKIKTLTALVGWLSLNVGWENGPEWGLKTISFNPYPSLI